MKLNESTIGVLQNFATIQSNLVVKSGNTIATMSDARNVLAVAELNQDIDAEFGIFDLNRFLSTINLVESPELKFQEKYVAISDDAASIRYYYSDPEILISPSKAIQMPDAEVNFQLTQENLGKIRRASSVLDLGFMSIVPCAADPQKLVTLQVVDENNDTSDCFSIDVPGQAPEVPFKFIISINNLKLMNGDYIVSVSSGCISKFTKVITGQPDDPSIDYYIALENDSTFGE